MTPAEFDNKVPVGKPFRTRLAAAPALRRAGPGHEIVALEQGGFAVREIPQEERAAAEPKPLSVGITPNATEPVTVKDGVVHIGKQPALDYESGEPVKVKAGASDAEVKQALNAAGALSRKQRFFGGMQEQLQQQQQASAGGRNARGAAWDRNPLRHFLATHGVSLDVVKDFAPGLKERRAAMVPGIGPIFRRGGKQLDELAHAAQEEGFLPKGSEPDAAAMHALIQRAVSGERVAPMYAEGVAEQEAQRRMEERAASHIEQHPELHDLVPHDLDAEGYERASAEVQDRVREIMAALSESERERILEDVAKRNENASDDDYLAALRQEAADASARSARAQDRGRPGGEAAAREAQGEAGRAPEGLTPDDGIVVTPGKGLIKGKFLSSADGHGTPGGPWSTEAEARAAAEAWRTRLEEKAANAARDRARKDEFAAKLRSEHEPTPAEVEAIGLRARGSDLTYFIPTAADLFGISSRAVRPLIMDLIRVGYTDMGAKRESVNPMKALAEIAKRQKEDGTQFRRTSDEQVTARRSEEAKPAKGLERDLLGEAPNASQQQAAKIAAAREQKQRDQQAAAPAPEEFKLTGSDRVADQGAARGQRDLLEGTKDKEKDDGGEPGAFFRSPDSAVRQSGRGMREQDLAAAIARPIKRLDVPVKVHASVEAMRRASGYEDIPGDVKGMHWKGQIHLVAENLHSALDAQETLWHEIEHAGIGRTLRSGSVQYEKALRSIALQNANVRAAAKQWMTHHGQDDYRGRIADGMKPDDAMIRTKLQAVEEALAQLSGSNPNIRGVNKFIAAVQQMMRSVGLDKLADWIEKQTNAQALSMILRHREAVIGGKPAAAAAREVAPAFSEGATRDIASYSRALDRAKDAVDAVKASAAAKNVGTAWDGVLMATAPQFRSPEAREMARQLIAGMGEKEMRAIRFRTELNRAVAESARAATLGGKARDLLEKGLTAAADKVFLRNSKEENLAFMQAMDSGDAKYFDAHPELKPMANVIGKMFDEKARAIQALDTGALQTVRENYFPHIWNREPSGDAQRQIFTSLSKRPLEGQKGFTKQRVFEDVKAGLDAGFEPVSNNPLDLVALKMEEMDKYLLAHSVLKSLEGTNGVHLIAAGEKTPQGYTDVNGRFGTIERNGQKLRYVAREDVAQVINNYLSPSLYHNKYVGKPFTAYMGAANMLNQFQLGVFSAFHAGFTSMEAVISHASIGIKALTAGDLKGAAKYLASAPKAWIDNPKLGNKIIEEMLTSGTHPEMAPIVEGLQLAGFKWQLDNRFRTDATKNMLQAWGEGRKFKAGLNSIPALAEQTARPILEWLVPRQKFGVFGEMYSKWMQDHPNATHEELRNSAQQIWNRVDSRLGQVVYDRLFVHNVAKNFAQMLIRAPGWTGGTILEVGGGIKDLAGYAKSLASGKRPESISDRAAYTLSMLMVTAVANGLLTALFTGSAPDDWKDLVAFRTGNIDEHGRPERFMLPTYMKDVLAYAKAPGTTLLNKSHPMLSLIGDIGKNRDFYGTEIRSEDANLLTQLAQTAGFAAKAFVPFWMKGVQKEQEREGSVLATAAPLVGVMPAPLDLNKTAAENLMTKYGADRMPQGSRTAEETQKADLRRQMFVALRKGEGDKAKDLFDQGRDAGLFGPRDYLKVVRQAKQDPLIASFNHLTFDQAQRVMKVVNEDERARLAAAFMRKRAAYQRDHGRAPVQ